MDTANGQIQKGIPKESSILSLMNSYMIQTLGCSLPTEVIDLQVVLL